MIVDLHGERAPEGVDLDALEGFLDAFRRALREYARHQKAGIPLKAGKPGQSIRAAAAFRLVAFKIGSGILTLEPSGSAASDEAQLIEADESAAMQTLNGLVEAIEGDGIPGPVLDALESARRTMGSDGHFGIRSTSATRVLRTEITAATVKALRGAAEELDDLQREISIVGFLHLIEVEDDGRRVNVRATDGTDWACSYDVVLEEQITEMLRSIVRVEGTGRRTSATAGRMAIEKIEALPSAEQTELFTHEPRRLAVLLREQGIAGPQGLGKLSDPAWGDDEEADRRFLEAMALIDAG